MLLRDSCGIRTHSVRLERPGYFLYTNEPYRMRGLNPPFQVENLVDCHYPNATCVDPVGIEPTAQTLQRSVAPLEHGSP